MSEETGVVSEDIGSEMIQNTSLKRSKLPSICCTTRLPSVNAATTVDGFRKSNRKTPADVLISFSSSNPFSVFKMHNEPDRLSDDGSKRYVETQTREEEGIRRANAGRDVSFSDFEGIARKGTTKKETVFSNELQHKNIIPFCLRLFN
uniref:Uncharacterized protein n=1 Tax=Caenorhabditis japonica TaxID=281687 RepID=A0A8R1EQC3_CAEJA